MALPEAEVEEGAVELWALPPDLPSELLTLYFENRRRSGGGPVRSWQRLGRGGIVTFQEPADAQRVLAQAEHELHGVRLNLRPAPPRAPTRLLLQGLPPGTAALCLEHHVQALLHASGRPVLPCRILASPRPDRALVQLPKPLSEADVRALQEQAQNLGLEGAPVSLAPVPQARAVRVLGGTAAADLLLLELYLESERRSGGGPLEDLRCLPRHLGAIATFQHWQVAERVLQRDHRLQDSELTLVPHYDCLEPEEELAEGTSGGNQPSRLASGATELAVPEAGVLAGVLTGAEAVAMGAGEALQPVSPPGQAGAVSWGPAGSLEQDRLVSPGPVGSADPVGPVEIPAEFPELLELPGQEGLVSLADIAKHSPEKAGLLSPGLVGQEGLVEKVLSMEPGAMRFLQLYHEDLLAGLGDVALFPIEGTDVTGFRLCGALAPCQAAVEFLQSLLGSISCHMLDLKHPGSAAFLLGPEGQHLLQGLEAQFQCVFGTERLARAALDTGPEEVDPTEVLQFPPGHSPTLWPPDSTGGDQESVSLEEIRELLATLEGLEGEDWLPLELGEEASKEEPKEPETTGHEEASPRTGAAGRLQEEATLQLALHQSLDPRGQGAKQEAAALQQALALSLLEQSPAEAGEPQGPGGRAQLLVHVGFEQDMDELDQALGAALEAHLREETVGPCGRLLPTELRAGLEQRHGVSVGLRGDRVILRGFGAQPARAARHLAALLAGPWDLCSASPLATPGVPLLEQRQKGPLGRLESLAASTGEFQDVVQAFCDSLDAARGAVPEICAHGSNCSFCGRNGTLYGQGVYFAARASLSVQDRYSPPNADGHKAVFVARVLTGDYGQGRQGLRAPPLRAFGDALLRYDSAVDCLQQPSIFVIFHDTQALPTHLITCEHMPGGCSGDGFGLSGPSPDT
ncbi:Poly [ADP-ribose] polymerase 10 [Tupaia chinensis]|uniref:Poly [ADP-ribose] polymerase n=1 Tax=Tupaia chinensis TaxID=246437 RepID=L9KLM5_TUPCH|nr:Poly [ADP-ribose] polymerase 10 [Tupaia chinensis]